MTIEAFKAIARERAPHYWALIRGDKPVGILLLLWPTWWALFLAADGLPPIKILIIFTLGVWLTRSAGCIVNDYADRNHAHVNREGIGQAHQAKRDQHQHAK